ncbi:MAG: peptidylprolyl isomerase [Planctomycetota bacterium]|nr:MAG: peptidylprolyl isomerase [Planctomycetota bacterium]REK24866.1 MAG: peptidylprolyl isomerase [Planctomycetota bacterium]REK40125.1 MAG: peptidylprolyl isomerase [Planctomycetota bacterium]
MRRDSRLLTVLLLAAGFVAASAARADDAADNQQPFQVKFTTTEGDFVVEVHPEWAPRGAARFRELVEAEYYDGCRFFRVIDGFMAQFGMHGDPDVNAKWSKQTIKDDKPQKSNTRGRITFATSGPDSRTTQLFINFDDNSFLDDQGFAPFGEVVEGMDVVDALYDGYGEGAPRGKGPSQGKIAAQGNDYLKQSFPELDYIETARIVEDDESSEKP